MYADFRNAHGAIPNYTTARSMAILARTFITRHPDILRITSARSFVFNGVTRNNTNQLVRSGENFFEGADGLRTGTTAEAGFCLTSTAVRDGRRIIVVVMNGSSNAVRYGDTRALLEFGFREVARREAERVHVVLDGEPMEFDVRPVMVGGRVMVPMRAIFEALGARVQWNGEERRITAHTDADDVLTLTVGSSRIYINGVRSEIDTAPQLINGRTMVPIRFVAQALGATVRWDAGARTVVIETT